MGFPVNDALELTRKESSSSTGVENLEFVEILYGRNFPTLVPDVTLWDSRLRLDSYGNDRDPVMIDTTICVISLACSKYNLGLVLF